MEPDVIAKIDHLRSTGASYDAVAAKLKEVGHPDPDEALKRYMDVPLPDGRPRGQINPGDPDERPDLPS